MTKKQFQKYLDRDGGRCWHCGTTETLVPHHRQNRGMGGSKLRDVPSNIIPMCADFNFRMESNTEDYYLAITYGWKITMGQHSNIAPVFSLVDRTWFILDDSFGRRN